MKVVQLLGLWGPWRRQVCRDTDCLHCRSYGPVRVFFPTSCSWRSEGLSGQSFSVALPVQALRGLPCLGFFSVVWCIRHIEGPPGGVLLCRLAHQAIDGPASPLFPYRCWLWGERGHADVPPPTLDSAVSPYFHGAWLSCTIISFHDLLPHIPSIHLSTVNSSQPQLTLGLLHNP